MIRRRDVFKRMVKEAITITLLLIVVIAIGVGCVLFLDYVATAGGLWLSQQNPVVKNLFIWTPLSLGVVVACCWFYFKVESWYLDIKRDLETRK